MPKPSAGLLVYRRTGGEPEVLLVHPGGPFWAKEDEGAWSIPKGEIDDPSDDPFAVAVREFEEELGAEPPDVSVAIALGELRQPSGKVVAAWAVEGDLDVSRVESNTFEM
ncbi:MAG TPA: NUDIX domain-containing protein, partial [Actinomycetota bacterium]